MENVQKATLHETNLQGIYQNLKTQQTPRKMLFPRTFPKFVKTTQKHQRYDFEYSLQLADVGYPRRFTPLRRLNASNKLIEDQVF